MHPALQILEVIDIISSHTEHRSLPALASTCRAFESPALNVLWRDLQSVEPLVKCLPSDLFGIDRECLVCHSYHMIASFRVQTKFTCAGATETS
ncbi:uncharacterized protein BJ212DRAFT_1272018 [Suillus subaureus]|uniref:F-box domain-containing protein n=1 Tax=Suillus subaureus TaxID=48587 RepID=A0A9P7EBE4_9AGAM|nr:uncharacterized protein BJ212DRAFT_1272018 [Suillus subaureus]KAG1816156.1 hypothetical protein BJ212DRAFT_1272018 [Suillus subaureus]